MGAEHPTDKSQIERELGTAKTSFFQKLPGCTYDIELMRQWGYEPETQQLCGIRKARELFDRYCHSRNLQKRKRLGKRAPAQMFLTQAMKAPVVGSIMSVATAVPIPIPVSSSTRNQPLTGVSSISQTIPNG